mmetsp:Transcript_9803/g.12126  ORF Transcript_9803/g.12126 Transcript_9803/m.12126 type:complete len:243 (+) Transcript_9803:709-1437(+)|eukprot:CAMPEP_0170477048 /NCGR_PEP_ID=MMETSP0123-20130129/18367_1 /TAXON_ID=182087 /ORGANISM="Favella ehrenbergii, Strain Fehren 1" /LENGTH=242 /DNA_ID=CAMNT_0010748505 /DNA_START=597 /DNA_END=1325 /DNA_ORIENTATION=+
MSALYAFDEGDWAFELVDLAKSFNEESDHVYVSIYISSDWRRFFDSFAAHDKGMINYALIVIVAYIVTFLGTCSPTYLRILVSLAGLGTVYMAILAGSGLCYYLGYYRSDLSDAIPFLMLGIGIDDMFVICNALDQTQISLPPHERIKQAMVKAGPSITMTSVTNALAFIAGYSSSILGIQSFCIHCSVSISLLYVSVLCVFLPVLYWDTIRVSKRCKELCGLCCCKDDSFMFCKGALMSAQ